MRARNLPLGPRTKASPHGSVTAGHACAPHYPVKRKTLKDFMARKRAVSRKLDDVVVGGGLFFFCFTISVFSKWRPSRGYGTKTTCVPHPPGPFARAYRTRSPPAPRTRVCTAKSRNVRPAIRYVLAHTSPRPRGTGGNRK